MKAGYYVNSRGNLAIVYPDKRTEVWIDHDNKVYFLTDNWLRFEMNKIYESVFEWEFLGDL